MVAKKANEVEAFLRRPDPGYPVVLVFGPNAGLVSERARQLARASVDDPDDAFQLVRIDGDDIASDPLRLIDEAGTVGLFGGRRCIFVRAGAKPLTTALTPLLADPPPNARVVIEAGDLQARNPLRTLLEGAKAAITLPCYADEARDIPVLAEAVLGEFGLRLDRDAREALTGLLGADRLLGRRELEKLALYATGDGTVTVAHVEAIMADASALVMDTVVDAAFAGDTDGLDRGIARIFAEGDDPGVVLGAALRHVMALHKARLQIDRGTPVDQITARTHWKRKASMQRQLGRWTATSLEQAIATLREAQAQARRSGAIGETVAARCLLTIATRAARASG